MLSMSLKDWNTLLRLKGKHCDPCYQVCICTSLGWRISFTLLFLLSSHSLASCLWECVLVGVLVLLCSNAMLIKQQNHCFLVKYKVILLMYQTMLIIYLLSSLITMMKVWEAWQGKMYFLSLDSIIIAYASNFISSEKVIINCLYLIEEMHPFFNFFIYKIWKEELSIFQKRIAVKYLKK